MQNPFKKNDPVFTKVQGKSVEATVVQTWKGKVQVKTTTGDLFWRSMYTPDAHAARTRRRIMNTCFEKKVIIDDMQIEF